MFIYFLLLMMTMESIMDLFMFWFYMELSTLILIFNMMKNMNLGSSNYFLMSSVSSIIFILYLITMNNLCLSIFLMIKLPLFPFVFWLVSLTHKMKFKELFYFLIWQKIPLIMILINHFISYYFYMIFLNLIFLINLCLKSSSLINSITLYSVYSSNWILMISQINYKLTFLYFLVFLLDYFMLKMMNKSLSMSMPNKMFSMNAVMILFSMMSLPPFPNFFIKLYILSEINSFFMIVIIMSMLVVNFSIQIMFLKHNYKLIMFNKSKPKLLYFYFYFYFIMLLFLF